MEELKIVKYIREHGLEQAIKRFDLIHKVTDNRILLKYNQLSSPTMFTNQEVQECRGLILEKDTLRVLSLAFYKFFNNGESNAHKIDWESAKILEKLDGSLIQLYEYNGTWYPATTGMISGEGEVNNRVKTSFSQLFWEIAGKIGFDVTKLNKNNVYVFELCSPYNIVVKPHKESSITLLTVRNRVTLEEFTRDGAEIVAAMLNVPIVKEFDINTDNVGFLLRTFVDMPWSEEGYVVVDKNFNRIKIKNPAYLAVHHLKGKTAEHNIVTIIKTNEIEEFIATFPEREEEIVQLEESYYDLLNKLELTWEELELRKPKNIMPSEKKRYAQAVFEVCEKYGIKEFSDLYFGLANGKTKSVKEYIDEMDLKKLWLILLRNKNGKVKQRKN